MAEGQRSASRAGRELGRLGARKGGRARARALTPAERTEIARRAVRARWAKSGKGPPPAAPGIVPGAATARSLFRGPLTLAGIRVEGHVLSDGRRVLGDEGVVEAFTGGTGSGGLDRVLGKLPEDQRPVAGVPTVPFRVPGRPGVEVGYEASTVVSLAGVFLAARAAGPLKKQPARAAETAEALVRDAAAVGMVGLIDEATGYAKVRVRQSARRSLQAFIAEDIGRWASYFPKEFWAQLARLDDADSPRRRSIGWATYVMLFVYDAIDADVGRELRRPPGDAPFRPTVLQWLDEIGPRRLERRMAAIVTEMQGCADMDGFTSAFAKVLHQGPSRAELAAGDD